MESSLYDAWELLKVVGTFALVVGFIVVGIKMDRETRYSGFVERRTKKRSPTFTPDWLWHGREKKEMETDDADSPHEMRHDEPRDENAPCRAPGHTSLPKEARRPLRLTHDPAPRK